VKIRGLRIELGEIEASLARHPGLREVLVVPDAGGTEALLAYYIAADGVQEISAQALRAHLLAFLPDYMVPAAYIRLDAFPLTANGKIDRAALPRPDADAYSMRAYHAPVGDVEHAIAGIWADLLKLDKVGRNDHFFELGGHSLLALSMIERMQREDLEVDVRVLFMTPTVAELAAATKKVKEFVL
ncbi:phosphopantetheine-binding protein, partial [Herbaspirillum sp. GCM10030257]|uniref:phosphopantetheine-binding protein n=1 Tax=Herbaspirillum sp. GCM10030257 TaxID=3273393 RepID=UPI00361CD4BC